LDLELLFLGEKVAAGRRFRAFLFPKKGEQGHSDGKDQRSYEQSNGTKRVYAGTYGAHPCFPPFNCGGKKASDSSISISDPNLAMAVWM